MAIFDKTESLERGEIYIWQNGTFLIRRNDLKEMQVEGENVWEQLWRNGKRAAPQERPECASAISVYIQRYTYGERERKSKIRPTPARTMTHPYVCLPHAYRWHDSFTCELRPRHLGRLMQAHLSTNFRLLFNKWLKTF